MRKLLTLSLCLFSSLAFSQTHFELLVTQGNLDEALRFVCLKYSLHCEKIRIVENIDGAYAHTLNYTNQIEIAKDTFWYDNLPDEAWTAAVIGHENIHQTQSFYVRQVAGAQGRLFGNYYWEATIELPAWGWMLEQANSLKLKKSQINEIQGNIEYYSYVTEYGGKLPPE